MFKRLYRERFVRFMFFGGVSVLVYYVILVVGVEFFDFNYLLGAGIGLLVQWVVNYILHHYLTFLGEQIAHRQLALHFVIFCFVLVGELLGLWLLVEFFGLHYLLAAMLAGLALLVPSYRANAWVFKK